jgi:predicted chitinase
LSIVHYPLSIFTDFATTLNENQERMATKMAKEFLNPAQISAITGAPPENVAAAWPLLCEALEQSGINAPMVQAGMAATIAMETGNFLPVKEKLAKPTEVRVYTMQMKYWKKGCYGRGYIQLTGEKNYAAASKALNIDLLANPDLALLPDVAAKIAAWFFRANGVHYSCNSKDWRSVRRAVNGPNYLVDVAAWERFKGYCEKLSKGAANG